MEPTQSHFGHISALTARLAILFGDHMNRLMIALAAAGVTLAVSTNCSSAQDFTGSTPSAEPAFAASSSDYTSGSEQKTSALRRVASEVVLLRYRAALKLT